LSAGAAVGFDALAVAEQMRESAAAVASLDASRVMSVLRCRGGVVEPLDVAASSPAKVRFLEKKDRATQDCGPKD
jgi:hypothetical protein